MKTEKRMSGDSLADRIIDLNIEILGAKIQIVSFFSVALGVLTAHIVFSSESSLLNLVLVYAVVMTGYVLLIIAVAMFKRYRNKGSVSKVKFADAKDLAELFEAYANAIGDYDRKLKYLKVFRRSFADDDNDNVIFELFMSTDLLDDVAMYDILSMRKEFCDDKDSFRLLYARIYANIEVRDARNIFTDDGLFSMMGPA